MRPPYNSKDAQRWQISFRYGVKDRLEVEKFVNNRFRRYDELQAQLLDYLYKFIEVDRKKEFLHALVTEGLYSSYKSAANAIRNNFGNPKNMPKEKTIKKMEEIIRVCDELKKYIHLDQQAPSMLQNWTDRNKLLHDKQNREKKDGNPSCISSGAVRKRLQR